MWCLTSGSIAAVNSSVEGVPYSASGTQPRVRITSEKDGYVAVQLAFGAIDPRKANKPRTGHFAKAGTTPRRHLVELRTSDAGEYSVGQEITAEVFETGAVVHSSRIGASGDESWIRAGRGSRGRSPS